MPTLCGEGIELFCGGDFTSACEQLTLVDHVHHFNASKCIAADQNDWKPSIGLVIRLTARL